MYEGERFNSISHLIGAALSLVGLIVLVVFAAQKGDPWKIVSFSIYGATLFLLYAASTLYHSWRAPAKAFLQKIDHIAIYLLIAGTYTPFTLITLRGPWGWSLFGVVWGLAITGIVLDSLHRNGKRTLQLIIYILMGWMIVIAMYPLTQNLENGGIFFLTLGGLFYTGGIGFYVYDKKLRHGHGIWHLFVLAGSISHYLAIVLYLV
ncbi:MAG: hemolysin III family protein [Gammaproteobacteria bacterium]|nr:hemolysin III family protein [Gammaproteobacteria bacterium]